MKKAIWFSRHKATPEQIEEIANSDYTLVSSIKPIELAMRNLTTDDEVLDVVNKLKTIIRQQNIQAVFGVFPVPMIPYLIDKLESGHNSIYVQSDLGATCYSAWNVMRSVEGEKPTFRHKKFVRVGYLG